MIIRQFTFLASLATALLLATSVAAQSGNNSVRTGDGRPDLSGVWDFRTVTPLERPAELADQEFLSEEEVAAYAAERVLASNADLNREARKLETTDRGQVNGTRESRDLALAYNDFWWDRGTEVVETRRTSLVIDPPNGRVPALTDAASSRAAERTRINQRPTEGPEDRPLGERCITGFNSGPPIVPVGYNQNIQLFQTSSFVVIFNEMVHDARIIPLDGRDHLPETVRQWMGDSRGYWEGDTLVVETTNFTEKTASFNSSVATSVGNGTTLHLTERFRRTSDDTLLYEFTINDSTTFTRPFTAALPMKRGEAVFEYACHEGNYGLFNMLAGARAEEQ